MEGGDRVRSRGHGGLGNAIIDKRSGPNGFAAGWQPDLGRSLRDPMEMALVLDASGSIAGFKAVDDVARLGAAISEKLVDRNIDLTIAEFSTFADTPIESVPLTTANVQSVFQPYFEGSSSPHYFDRRTGLYTNWQDAFRQVQIMPITADLVIFVSDGKANTIGDRSVAVNGNASHAHATASAIELANEIKSQGTHVIGVGVGGLNNDEGRALVQSLSGGGALAGDGLGDGDFFVGEFSELFRIVNEFPRDLCEGTTMIKSLIDADGDLSTSDDQTAAIGWPIDLSQTNGDFRMSSPTTGEGGTVILTPDWAGNGKARFKFGLTQPPLPGYDVAQMSCTRARERGEFDGGSQVRGIEIARGNLTECTIINVPIPPMLDFDLQTLSIADVDESGTNSPGDIIYYKATAHNTGGTMLTKVTVSSHFIDWRFCNRRDKARVPIGKKMVCWGSYVITDSDTGNQITHDATADSKQTSGIDDREVADVPRVIEPAKVPEIEPDEVPHEIPGIDLDKVIVRTDDIDGNDRLTVGDVLHYELRVTNTGTANLSNVVVEDSLATPDCGDWTDGFLPVGGAVVCRAAVTIEDRHVLTDVENMATVSSSQTDPVTDSERVTIPLIAMCRGDAVLFEDFVVLMGTTTTTVSADAAIDPGSYSLRLAGIDWGHEAGKQTTQTEESFVVEFLDDEGTIIDTSGASADIPEADYWMIADVPGTVELDRPAVSVRARHKGTRNANSVSPICVEIDSER